MKNQPLARVFTGFVATDFVAICQAVVAAFTFRRQLLMPSEAELRAGLERDRAVLGE